MAMAERFAALLPEDEELSQPDLHRPVSKPRAPQALGVLDNKCALRLVNSLWR